MAKYIQEIADLKKQLAEAKAAKFDDIRLAELESENSRLRSELNVVKQHQLSAAKPNPQPNPQPKSRISTNVYRRHIMDGYSSWN